MQLNNQIISGCFKYLFVISLVVHNPPVDHNLSIQLLLQKERKLVKKTPVFCLLGKVYYEIFEMQIICYGPFLC